MIVSLIVARSTNGVIGVDGDLPWHLSADLKRFRRLTTGHWIIMGRKTWQSIGRPLPQRTSVVISRNLELHCEGAVVANSLERAIEMANGQAEVFIIGGATIYQQALPLADRLHVTQVHTQIDGDVYFPVYFPEVDLSKWNLVEQSDHSADEKNRYNYSFLQYERTQK